jgi:uncharacterized protein
MPFRYSVWDTAASKASRMTRSLSSPASFMWAMFRASSNRRSTATLVGVPIIGIGVQHNFANQWVSSPRAYLIGVQHNYWASMLVSLGWIGAVMLLCRSAVLEALKRALAAVGRTAFSNYILQTVLCTTIFYGHGLGLFGQVERSGLALIVLAIWLTQLTISPIWLRHFHFGPLEWLWRSLSYRKVQPFRRG